MFKVPLEKLGEPVEHQISEVSLRLYTLISAAELQRAKKATSLSQSEGVRTLSCAILTSKHPAAPSWCVPHHSLSYSLSSAWFPAKLETGANSVRFSSLRRWLSRGAIDIETSKKSFLFVSGSHQAPQPPFGPIVEMNSRFMQDCKFSMLQISKMLYHIHHCRLHRESRLSEIQNLHAISLQTRSLNATTGTRIKEIVIKNNTM